MKEITEDQSIENDQTGYKVCTKCRKQLSKSSFNMDCTKSDRLQTHCRDCKHKDQKRHYNRLKDDYLSKQAARRRDNPDMQKAHSAVHRAIKSGRLVRPTSCPECGNSKMRIEAHHHKGYAPEFALDVVFLCTSCHRSAES